MPNGQIDDLLPMVARPTRASYVSRLEAAGASQEETQEAWRIFAASDLYETAEYLVQLIKAGHDHLSGALSTFTLVISRKDETPVSDWRDVQEIKNRMVGRDVDAVEIFPAASRGYDYRNRTVLFCYVGGSEPGNTPPRLPFGARQRIVTNQSILPHCQQRALAT